MMQKITVSNDKMSGSSAGPAILQEKLLTSDSAWKRAARRFRRNPATMLGAVLILIVIVAALFPVSWLPHDPYIINIRLRFVPPFWMEGGSTEFLLGTEALGRDNLSMIIHGARFSMMIVVFSAALSLIIGVTVGLLAGYFRGRLDDVIMRLADIQLAFPVLVLIIAIVAVLGPSVRNLVIVIGITRVGCLCAPHSWIGPHYS